MKKDQRCSCKKLLCQFEGDTVVLKCRHCKKMLYIHTRGLISMEYKIETQATDIHPYRETYQSH